jgi:hypothetical protein
MDHAMPVPSRSMGVRPPGAYGGTCLIFLSLDHLGPSRVDRAGLWTVPTRGPPGFGPARPGPFAKHYTHLARRVKHVSIFLSCINSINFK